MAPPSGAFRRGTIAVPLLRWFRAHRRDLPWRRDRDPYRIWVAEVLLQQTRVEQARPYFDRFLSAFPTVRALASASEEEVLRVWAGAGYYARARNLRNAARTIVEDRGGQWPTNAAEWAELPGVGPYISAAVASLADGEPVVALDANGLRVAARLTAEAGPTGSPGVRRRLHRFLEQELPPRRPGAFNEALMELGETVCRPRRPNCPECPLAFRCQAFRNLPDPGELPFRRAKSVRPHQVASVVALRCGDRWLVQRRASEGLLGGLWEFPGGKWAPGEGAESAARRELLEETGLVAPPLTPTGVISQSYSHFTVDLHLFEGEVKGPAPGLREPGRQRWVTWSEFDRLPVPKATERAAERLRSRPDTVSRGSGSRPGRTPASRRKAARSRPARAPLRPTHA
jgi:A/G-specific adenine glycosylase